MDKPNYTRLSVALSVLAKGDHQRSYIAALHQAIKEGKVEAIPLYGQSFSIGTRPHQDLLILENELFLQWHRKTVQRLSFLSAGVKEEEIINDPESFKALAALYRQSLTRNGRKKSQTSKLKPGMAATATSSKSKETEVSRLAG